MPYLPMLSDGLVRVTQGEKRPRNEGDDAQLGDAHGGTATAAAAPELSWPLPPGWAQAIDPTYNTAYWFCRATGVRSWTHPAAASSVFVAAPPPPPPPPPPAMSKLPPGWRTVVEPTTGRPYYAHATGETSWTRPPCAAAAAGLKRCKGCGGFGVGLLRSHGFCLHCSVALGCMPPGVASVIAPPAPPAATLPAPTVGLAQPAPAPRSGALMSAAAAAASARGARAAGRGGGRGRGFEAAQELDPMDPSSYSDAPRGGWGAGLYKPDDRAAAASRVRDGGAVPAAAVGGIGAAPAPPPRDGKDGLGEAD